MISHIRTEDLEALIAEFERSDCTELHARVGGLEVFLSKRADSAGLSADLGAPEAPAPPPAVRPSPSAAAPTPPVRAEIPAGCVVVEAPYQGIFYRAPKPGAAPYAEIGDEVAAADDLCLIEVMKLFTVVRAGANGVLREVLACDGEMVEAGRPLFLIEAP